MEEELRRRYLDAMGIQVWRLHSQWEAERSQLGGQAASAAGSSNADPADANAPASESMGPPKRAGSAPPLPDVNPPHEVPEGEVVAPPSGNLEGVGWPGLQRAVATCCGCEQLCRSRTQTVFGVGDPKADLMVIGEAPGADEDRRGEPFVGRAGQLLNLMLLAIGLQRQQVYIGNILKCRPPGNRDPRPDEALRCERFLMRQLALVEPRVILSVGRISAQNLLKTTTPIGKLRGRWHQFGPQHIPLMVTYHPAYLLRSPDQKARAWHDLQQVWERLTAVSS